MRRGGGLMSSGVIAREVRKAVMLSPFAATVDDDDENDENDDVGRGGSRMPVRGIVHSPSPTAYPSSVADCVSDFRSVLSSPIPVAMTGREPDTRPMHNRHRALTTSSTTTTRQRIFSPARLASISSSSCVYCIVLNRAAQRA